MAGTGGKMNWWKNENVTEQAEKYRRVDILVMIGVNLEEKYERWEVIDEQRLPGVVFECILGGCSHR